jgi:ABC-type multidrug transport system ATPase subunit
LEEVEALADRVAIMVAGSLRCLGSLQHLKTKFGSGFELTMRLESESHVPAVTQFISATIPTATLQEERLGKITYALPPDAKLSAVFASVEQRKAELHILDYTVSQTSLEQVFLRIGADAFHEEE